MPSGSGLASQLRLRFVFLRIKKKPVLSNLLDFLKNSMQTSFENSSLSQGIAGKEEKEALSVFGLTIKDSTCPSGERPSPGTTKGQRSKFPPLGTHSLEAPIVADRAPTSSTRAFFKSFVFWERGHR